MRINKSRDYVQHKVKQPKTRHMYKSCTCDFDFIPLETQSLSFGAFETSYILKIIPGCKGFTNYKFPAVLLIAYFNPSLFRFAAIPSYHYHTIVNKGNSVIEIFQKSKVCILLEWFNPCKYQDFPLSHGWFGTWSGWKSSLFTWAFTEKVRFGENLVQLTPVKTGE